MPRLAEGIELIGEYEGSGFKETPYLARRADGQVLQLTQLLYLVAEEVDGESNFGQISERVSEKFGRRVSPDNIKFLVEKKLRPLGMLAAADGTSPELERADPMLALNLRTGIVPERAVRAITTIFYPLFYPPVILFVLGGLAAFDVWFFFIHGVAQSVRDITYQPVLFLMVFGLVVLSTAFHECGHATACRYGDAKPGVIGVGIYLVYPAFFSDVTDAYRLSKWGRVRTDLGGIYFNMIFSLLTAGAYFLTAFEPLLAVILIQHLEMAHQLLPFLRLDGYYVVSDITGVPDLFSRIRPILRSLIPGRDPGTAVTALKPWVRVVVTTWVLTVIPILLYFFATIAITMPRLVATAWDSFLVQYDKLASALSNGEPVAVAADSIQIIFLILPLAGLTYTLFRAGKNLSAAAWNKTEGKPALRTGLVSAVVVVVGFLAFTWWPDGDYKPIQPGERGTLQSSIKLIKFIPTGRPGLIPEREAELNGAPTMREQPASPTGASMNEPDRVSAEPTSGSTPSVGSDESEPNVESSNQQLGEPTASASEQPSGGQQSGQPTKARSSTQTQQSAPERAVPEEAQNPQLAQRSSRQINIESVPNESKDSETTVSKTVPIRPSSVEPVP